MNSKAILIALGSLAALSAHAQERIAVPLSDASRPAVLEVNTFGTAINVSATDGKEVVIVARDATAKDAEGGDPEVVLSNAPKRAGNFFVVPKVVE